MQSVLAIARLDVNRGIRNYNATTGKFSGGDLHAMDETLTHRVNGDLHTETTDPNRPLLDVLREDLGLTGAKYGCG